jgi:hypothetical protein
MPRSGAARRELSRRATTQYSSLPGAALHDVGAGEGEGPHVELFKGEVALPQLADDPRHGCLSRGRRAFDPVPVVVVVLEFPDAWERMMSGSFPLGAMT